MIYGNHVSYSHEPDDGPEWEWEDDGSEEVETLERLSIRTGGRFDDYGNEMPWVEERDHFAEIEEIPDSASEGDWGRLNSDMLSERSYEPKGS